MARSIEERYVGVYSIDVAGQSSPPPSSCFDAIGQYKSQFDRRRRDEVRFGYVDEGAD